MLILLESGYVDLQIQKCRMLAIAFYIFLVVKMENISSFLCYHFYKIITNIAMNIPFVLNMLRKSVFLICFRSFKAAWWFKKHG